MNNKTLDDIIENFEKYHKGDERGIYLIQKAYVYSVKKHGSQVRKSGEPYVIHPIEVAYIVSDMGMDAITIAASFLHDVIEDTGTSKEEIEDNFGKDVSDLVFGLTKFDRTVERRKEKSILRLSDTFSRDERVMVIKLVDRLHNMRTLSGIKDVEKRKSIALETQEIFAPFAQKLCMRNISDELFDRSFEVCESKKYGILFSKVSDEKNRLKPFLDKIILAIEKVFKTNNFKAKVFYEHKPLYEISRKIELKNGMVDEKSLEEKVFELGDLFVVNVVVESVEDCFKTIFYLHKYFNYLPKSMEDHINLYDFEGDRYLSTFLFYSGESNESKLSFEVRIRTENMYRISREGVTAFYKYGMENFSQSDKEWLNTLKDNIEKLVREKEYEVVDKVDGIKESISSDYIYVITAVKGDTKRLPKGSSVVDLAYTISTDLGDHCDGAIVNGKMVPISYVLRENERVLILRNEKVKPIYTWLSLVKTTRAKRGIKRAIRRNITDRGEELFLKELKKRGIDEEDFSRWFDEKIRLLSDLLGKMRNLRNLYYVLGVCKNFISPILDFYEGKLSYEEFKAQILPGRERGRKKLLKKVVNFLGKETGGIEVDADFMEYYPYCPVCSPIYGEDSVIAFSDDGIELHVKKCKKYKEIKDNFPSFSVKWPNGFKRRIFRFKIFLKVKDRQGLLKTLSNLISKENGNIVATNVEEENDLYNIRFEVDVMNFSSFSRIVRALKGLEEVKSIDLKRKGIKFSQ